MTGCRDRGELALVTESPGGTFRVEVVGNLTPSLRMIVSHPVEAVVLRSSGHPYVRMYLYEGGFLDDGFAARFAEPVWREETVLVFSARMTERTPLVSDVFVLRNESGAVIRSARVASRDLTLAFDIPDGSQREIRLGGQADQPRQVWLTLWGDSSSPPAESSNDAGVLREGHVRWTVTVRGGGRVEWQQELVPGSAP